MAAPVEDVPVVVTGASGFLAKHIIAEVLKRGMRVRATLRRAPDEKKEETHLESGDFSIELSTHQIFVRGVRLPYVKFPRSPNL